MKREKIDAVICDVFLGICEHGCFTCNIVMELYGGSSYQTFGGLSLDTYDYESNKRVGCPIGMTYLIRILKVLECNNFFELKGMTVKIDHDWEKIYGLGNVNKDEWFYPETLWNKEK